jgi:hypothetical protein
MKYESLAFKRAHKEPMWMVYLNNVGLALTFGSLIIGSVFILSLGIGVCLFIALCYLFLTFKEILK